MLPGLQLLDLRRRFGDVVALDGVSFDVDEGRIVGSVGPNGGAVLREGAEVRLRDAWRASA